MVGLTARIKAFGGFHGSFFRVTTRSQSVPEDLKIPARHALAFGRGGVIARVGRMNAY